MGHIFEANIQLKHYANARPGMKAADKSTKPQDEPEVRAPGRIWSGRRQSPNHNRPLSHDFPHWSTEGLFVQGGAWCQQILG
jgi:hypothetical protein